MPKFNLAAQAAAATVSECAGYIVYQSGRPIIVFGTGATTEEAIADANQWIDPKGTLTAENVEVGTGYREVDGGMYIAPATQRLIDRVRADGGDVACSHNENGVADVSF